MTMVTTMTTTTMMMRLMVVMHGKASRSGMARARGRCFTVTVGGNKVKNKKVTQQKDKKPVTICSQAVNQEMTTGFMMPSVFVCVGVVSVCAKCVMMQVYPGY